MKILMRASAKMAMASTCAIAATLVVQGCSSEAETKAAPGARSQNAADSLNEMENEAKRIGDELREDAVEFSEEIQEQAAAARTEIEDRVKRAAEAIDDSNADDALEALKRELENG